MAPWTPGNSATGLGLEIQGDKAFLEALYPAAAHVQRLAEKNYELWQADPEHPSLHFKKLRGGHGNRFSIRIGDHYRALGLMREETVEWVWIGTHEDYNKL